MSDNSTDIASAFEEAAKASIGSDPGYYCGPYLLAAFLDMVLCGLVFCQFGQWMTFAKQDKITIRLLNIYTLLISIAYSGFTLAFVLHLFASGFGVYGNFVDYTWVSTYPLLNGLTSWPIQCFYMERAYRLNKNNKLILVLTAALLLGSMAGGIGTRVQFTLHSVYSASSSVNLFIDLWLGATAGLDVGITVLIMWGLHRTQQGWLATDKLWMKIYKLTNDSQLAPLVLASTELVLWLVKHDSLSIFFVLIQSKVYVVGYLANLNSDYALQKSQAEESDVRTTTATTFALKSARPNQATVDVSDDRVYELAASERDRSDMSKVYDVKDFAYDDYQNSAKLDYGDNFSRTGLPQTHASTIV